MSGTSKSGRKRKPKELKLLEGRFRADRDGNPPSVVGGFPLAPAGLSEAELALWQTLPKAPWIGESDTLAVWAAVDVFTRLLELRRQEQETGERQNDAAMKLWAGLRTWLVELGLTPAARAKMPPVKADDTDSDQWAQLLG